MKDDDFNERVRQLASDEIGGKQWGWFYLSWADEKGWLGAAYIRAYGPVTARLRCSAMEINPGGQCIILRIPADMTLPPVEYRNRLLNKEEILTFDPDAKSLGEWKKERP
jgi:hypothetical protein